MRSLRSESFCCLMVNCLAVACMVVVLSLTLYSPQPVILIGVGLQHSQQVNSLAEQKANLLTQQADGQSEQQSKHQAINGRVGIRSPTSFPPALPLKLKRDLFHSPHKIPTALNIPDPTLKSLSFEPEKMESLSVKDSIPSGLSDSKKSADHSSSIQQVTDIKSGNMLTPGQQVQRPNANLDKLPYIVKKKYVMRPSLSNLPYVVRKEHISRPRVLSNSNADSAGVKRMNMTEQTLMAMKMRNKVVDDTAAQFASKHDVLPLAAFIDTRPRYGRKNSTVILVQVRDVKRIRYNRIIGCGVDNIRASSFRVKPLLVYRNWIHSNVPNLTHSEAVVNCYDLPSHNGSKAFVLYRPYKVVGLLKVYAERPVAVLKGPMKPGSVVVCSTVYDEPPWLSHWLRYQQTIGVDHIHLYAQHSFVEQGGLATPELIKLVERGMVTVDVRSQHLGHREVYYYSQPLYYQDCLLRYRGVYDFAILIDTDDFFVPQVTGESDIHYYMERLFPKNSRLASIKLDWVRYFPACGFNTPLDQIMDGNLTAHLSTYKNYREYVKSIHRLEYVVEGAIHEVTYIMPGYRKGVGDNSTAYFAHIRMTASCDNTGNKESMKISQYEEEEE